MNVSAYPDEEVTISIHRVMREEIDRLIPGLEWKTYGGYVRAAVLYIGKIKIEFYEAKGE